MTMEESTYYKKITSDAKALEFNLRELWEYRDLIFLLVRREFVAKYKQTVLGPAWAIIQPLLTTVVFTFVFGNIAGLADCEGVPSFLFYMCGNVAWGFFAGCLTGTSNTFIGNSAIMGKVYFPRLVMPVSTAMGQLISFGIQSAMFAVFLVFFMFVPGYSIQPNWVALLSPIFVLQMMLLGMGCGVIVSALTTKYRDLQMLVSFGVSLWMYATPVAYSLSVFNGHPVIMTLVSLNPMTPVIEFLRYGFLGPAAGTTDWLSLAVSWAITLALLVIGVLLFNRVAKTFMDTV